MKSPMLFQRCAPETQGVSSRAVLEFLDAVEQEIHEMHSIMLLRHGHVVAEGWWAPYAPQRPHMLFSLSKSFTSSAIGLAAAEGRLSIDDPVVSFFPEQRPARISPNLAAMKIRHLLSMSTGHALDTTGRIASRKDGDWVKGFLSLGVKHRPGTHFVYNSGATYMLSAILQKVTGMSLLAYLQPRLFEPLGIQNPTWETCPRGINTGGWGLSVCTEDIARFGQLYLQKGVWNGQRILSQEWVAQATAFQVQNSHPTNPDWRQGYGFQFWRCQHGAYRGDGAFGQFCVVLPGQDAVIAITSGVSNMQAVLNLVWKHLLPALQPQALPPDSAAQKALEDRCSSLKLLPPSGAAASPMAGAISGKTYRFKPNPMKLESMSVRFSDRCELKMVDARGSHALACGSGEWIENQSALFASPRRGNVRPSIANAQIQPVSASAVWTAEDTLQITLRRVETPFYHTLTCRFADGCVEVDTATNVSFSPEKATTLKGTARK